MELKGKYDVLIVGSGPAGAGAAKALNGTGLDTVIVEQKKLPRYKMCSGIVFPSSRKVIAEDFGIIPQEILCAPAMIKGNRVAESLDGTFMDIPFSDFDVGDELEEEGFNTWRSKLDFWLCCHADAGLVGNCRFHRFEARDRGYVVELEHCGRKVSVQTNHLVAADGALSRVRQTAFPLFDKTVGRIPNYEEIYTGKIDLEPGWLYIFLDRSLTGYFATVFQKDDLIVLVTGVQQKESVKAYFSAFRSFLEEKHGLVIKEKRSSHGIVLTDISAQKNYCLGTGNLLLTGEAGGFLRGGEGITSSLLSGKAAGQAILESGKSGRPAIDRFRELAADEIGICEQLHEEITAIAGFNFFTRE